MGVPAFFRWLTKKYPSTIVNANEERQRDVDGKQIPVDCTQANPNFQEFDNLYLDMNGIIHPCTHPEDRPAPKNEDEMFVLIFEYIDRIFSIVRPRKLLYMAIDGVAPRAKMNQQRSRRFRASKEAIEKQMEIDEVRKRLDAEGIPLPPKKAPESHFDSNCITPGTPFMARLADALRYYIHDRLTNDPAWHNIQVILSDANAPGEGEHKIMDFVRRQRANPAHNPDTVHCLCGADADLIMLGLATHESNFNIIREEFVPNQQRPCELCGKYGHDLKSCKGLEDNETGEKAADDADPLQKGKNFIFLRIPVLREYLEKELTMPNLPFKWDFERAIDDWVFLCFFVGNDFLPHLPSLEIREGAIDRLIRLYKDMVYNMNGYLTHDGSVYLDRVEMIMKGLGEVEDEIFKRRQQNEERYQAQQKARKVAGNRGGRSAARPAYIPGHGSLIEPTAQPMRFSGTQTRELAHEARVEAMRHSENEEAARRLKTMMKGGNDDQSTQSSRKRKSETPINPYDEEEEDGPTDEIRLHESGWKDRYYRAKFDVGGDDCDFRKKVAWAYVEGLCWVLQYYYQGCASWDWYFPYHYAPFASDFNTVSQFKLDFSKKTKPFKPLEQLMSVFPAASKQHLPEKWQLLMTEDSSPIIDFYPIDFRIDLNGKKFAWQGVALLPFVDEQRLLKTLETVYPTLTDEEKARNTTGPHRLFVSAQHPVYELFKELYASETDGMDVDSALTNGMSGRIVPDSTVTMPGTAFTSPVMASECQDLQVNNAINVIFEDPHYTDGFVFPATRLKNATELPKTLKLNDWNDNRDGRYRPQIGFSRDAPQARLDQSGHRHVRHELGSGYSPQNNFNPGYRGRGQPQEYGRGAYQRGRGDSSGGYGNYQEQRGSGDYGGSNYGNNQYSNYNSGYGGNDSRNYRGNDRGFNRGRGGYNGTPRGNYSNPSNAWR